MKIWIGSDHQIQTGKTAEQLLKVTNDSSFATEQGVVEVTEDRWKQAQRFELTLWQSLNYVMDDRSTEHKTHFNSYNNLPQSFEHALEIGSGPFTQLLFAMPGRTIKQITLLDPLLDDYRKLPNCSYRDNHLGGVPITGVSKPAELYSSADSFDLIFCINVLEHTFKPLVVLDNIYDSLKVGGYIVFHDRSWDKFDTSSFYDVGHPIRLQSKAFNNFFNRFHSVQQHAITSEFDSIAHYFIGVK